jgi:hypothetical protein
MSLFVLNMLLIYCLMFLMFCCVICKRDPASEQLNSYKLSNVSTLLLLVWNILNFHYYLRLVSYIVVGIEDFIDVFSAITF